MPGAGRLGRRWDAAWAATVGWCKRPDPGDAGRWRPLQGFCGRAIIYPKYGRIPVRVEAGLEMLGARLDPTFGGPHRDSSDNTRSPETDSLCAKDGRQRWFQRVTS